MTGTLRKSEGPSGSTFSMKQVRDRCQQTLPAADFYVRLAKLGLEYGPSFRGIRELYFGEREALAKVRLPEGLATAEYLMHPAFLDACLHTYPLVLDGAGSAKSNGGSSYLPVSLAGFRCYQDGVDQAWVHTTLRSVEEDDTQVVDIRVYDAAERPVAELEGLAVRLLPLEKVNQSRAGADDLFYQVAWRRRVQSGGQPRAGSCACKLDHLRRCERRRRGAGRPTGSGGPSLPPRLQERYVRQTWRPNVDRERTAAARFSSVAGAIRFQ